MTAQAAAYQLTDAEISGDIKQANLNTVAGALTLACDLIEEVNLGKVLSAEELEFVAHCCELAAVVSQ